MLRLIAFLFIYAVSLINSQEQQQQIEKFKYSTILDHDNRIRLEWNIDKSNRVIRFNLFVVALRKFPYLIGFGASDRGLFTNADLVVFEIKSRNDNLTYLDCYTDRKGVLKVDQSGDYVLESFKVFRSIFIFLPL